MPTTRLIVPVLVRDLAAARRDVALAAEAGADTVELRIDRLTSSAEVASLIADAPVPVLLTCRPTWEGGQSERSDAERFDLLSTSLTRPGDWADVEHAALARTPHPAPPLGRRVVSRHDFTGRPARLTNHLLEMADAGAVTKLVWTARSVRDNVEAFDILLNRHKPTTALLMGEHGLPSRVLAKKFGGWATYAALGPDAATAPGQVTIDDLKRLYRWDALGPQTRVYGVVGDPVGHSMSPATHNAAFDAIGHDGVYLPLRVSGSYEAFKAFMETFVAFAPLHVRGLSVTIPHKANALRYLREIGGTIEPLAGRLGVINTITRESDGALAGSNTDAAAIVACVRQGLGRNETPAGDDPIRGMRVVVFGAGGTGRTAVAALATLGGTVTVVNRTRERAGALVTEFADSPEVREAGGSITVATTPPQAADVYINATSLGMTPNVDASPFADAVPESLAGKVAFDTVYNPMSTLFLRQAASAGAVTVSGTEMFVRQAAAQFQTWTGLPAPADVMRRTVRERLAFTRPS